MKVRSVIETTALLLCTALSALSQEDSARIKETQVKELDVRADKLLAPSTSVQPAEMLMRKELEKLSSNSVADAVRQLPSVMLKDYGGIGGLKTISVRSLGAEHTGVQLDGVKISDAQTGQIDLGRFSLENVERIELMQGNPENECSPAKAFASASVLNIVTRSQDFSSMQKPVEMRASTQIGSFGFFGASLAGRLKLAESIVAAINAERQTADGRYDYVFLDGSQRVNLRRQNADVQSMRIEADVGAEFSESSKLTAKLYRYTAERGLPNAAIIGNFENSRQRLWNRDVFAQATLETKWSEVFQTAFRGKVSENYLRFQDPNSLREGGIDDDYTQRELYGSLAAAYKPVSLLTLNIASDIAYNTLRATPFEFSQPQRWSWLTVVGAKATLQNVNIEANVLATLIRETTASGLAAKPKEELTPTIAIGYKPFAGEGFRLRASYKSIFRMPTFNDLYYTRVGNVNLRPERVQQFNIGAGYELHGGAVRYAAIRVDGFRSLVRDKILAVPRDAFNWSMQNLTVVETNGVDVHLEATLKKIAMADISFSANYTYQTALDKTPESLVFGQQIAYTPFETASGVASISVESFSFSWILSYVGYRYQLGENIQANLMLSYLLNDLTARVEQPIAGVVLALKMELNNIFDIQYDVIRSFPMPGRNARVSLTLTY